MLPFKKDFINFFVKRHKLIKSKIKIFTENKKIQHDIAGPPESNGDKTKELFEIYKNFSHARKFPKRQFYLQLK